MKEVLLYLSVKYEGQFDKIYQAIQRKEKVDEEELEEIKNCLKCNYTTIVDKDYPQCLKEIPCPPFVLYYYGDISLLDKKTIGIIGMRKPSDYGIKVTSNFAGELAGNNFVTVSGLALGVDTIVHQQTINNDGKTIAVLGCGIDYCYPRENIDLYEIIKENHLVVSEYPNSLEPKKWNFPARNRLIAGISQSLLITECVEKSGAMITVGFALEQGKEIMAVPSPIYGNNGCNSLIKNGAKAVENIEDIQMLL